MKELSIEEKAKAYDEAIKKAKECHTDGLSLHQPVKDVLEYIFPELKESEDEKVRKGLIGHLKECRNQCRSEVMIREYAKWIHWLEKQGEQKPTEEYNITGIGSKNAQGKLGEMIMNLKLVNKVKPKFRVGDKIRRKAPHQYDKDMQVSRIESNHYICNHLGKFSSESISFSEESNYELVERKSNNKVEPFDKCEGLTDFERTLADICIGWIGKELGWKEYIKDNADVLLKIAIKMFNSVQDAHFEQKPDDWSEEDELMFMSIIQTLKLTNGAVQMKIDWLKSIKDRVCCEVNCTTTKEWKPSKEQMEALWNVYRGGKEQAELATLYNDLKKL